MCVGSSFIDNIITRGVCVFVRPTFFVVQLCALVVYQWDKTGATDLAGNAVRTEFAEAERRRYFAQQSDDVQVLDAASAATSSQSDSVIDQPSALTFWHSPRLSQRFIRNVACCRELEVQLGHQIWQEDGIPINCTGTYIVVLESWKLWHVLTISILQSSIICHDESWKKLTGIIRPHRMPTTYCYRWSLA